MPTSVLVYAAFAPHRDRFMHCMVSSNRDWGRCRRLISLQIYDRVIGRLKANVLDLRDLRNLQYKRCVYCHVGADV